VLFNYTAMGSSEGEPNRNQTVASYDAVLRYLEDREGVGAEEIICWGTSMGGGVKGHAFKRHTFQNDIRYVSISESTYRKLSDAVTSMINPVLSPAIRAAGWQLSSKSSSVKLPIPEIVLHTAKQLYPKTKDDIEHDSLFGGTACLAGHLLHQKSAHE